MSWVSDLLDRVVLFLPTVEVVQQFEGAVFLRCGRHKTRFYFRRKDQRHKMLSLKAGVYVCWPFIDSVFKLVKVDQMMDLRNQSVITSDGKDCVVSGAIGYSISFPHLALLNVENVDRVLSRLALGVIAEYVNARTFDECCDLDSIKGALQEGIKESTRKWGLNIWTVRITDFGNAINLRHLTNKEDSTLCEED